MQNRANVCVDLRKYFATLCAAWRKGSPVLFGNPSKNYPMNLGHPRLWAALFALLLSVSKLFAQLTSVTGVVRNANTGQTLQGVSITVAASDRETTTDEFGRFMIGGLADGEHVLNFNYIGVDPVSRSIVVKGGEAVVLTVEMSSGIYELPEFVVSGQREGNAAALVRQKTADNVKNVVSLDAFGNLPNENAGDLLARLPGVAGVVNEDGDVSGMVVRGTAPALNTVSVNNNLQSSSGGMSRDYRTNSLTGAIFDELEVIKANTPDMSAESLGGAVNLKTRSALKMKEKRRIEYRVGGRWAPPFYEHTPEREKHRLHPLVNLQYQEAFDVMDGVRNLGVSASGFYSKNINGGYWTIQDYANTTASPAYLWDYRLSDTFGNRQQSTFSLNLEQKVGDHTLVFVRGFYNDAFELGQKRHILRAYLAGDGQGGLTTPSVIKYYDENVTEVQYTGVNNQSILQLQSIIWSFLTRERQIQVGAEHEIDRLKIDYDFNYNANHANLGNGARGAAPGGQLSMDIRNIGWLVDKTGSEMRPTFSQTTGASIYDLANYRNALMVLRDNKRNTDIYAGSLNAKYALPVAFPVMFKAGYRYREQQVAETNETERWRYNYAATPFPTAFISDSVVQGAEGIPFIDTVAALADIQQNAQNRWTKSAADLTYEVQQHYQGTRNVTEAVHAGYVMGQAKIAQLNVLAGMRYERTEVEGVGYVLDNTSNYVERTITGSYDDFFPSVHFTYALKPNLLARISWSNTIGRPAFTNFTPLETVSHSAQTVTVNNPSLKPQYSQNWDFTLERYFEPVGQVSVGLFYKSLSDFIVSADAGTIGNGADNGFDGNYEGYLLRSQFNGGKARIRGMELNWQQQFSFLPGPLKGLGAFANLTVLTTEGDYGGSINSAAANPITDLAMFVPRTANVGLSYLYKRINARILVNHAGSYLADYATSAARMRYLDKRTTVNASASYRLNKHLSVYCDVINAFNEPQRWYRYSEDRLAQAIITGTTVNFGLSGRF